MHCMIETDEIVNEKTSDLQITSIGDSTYCRLVVSLYLYSIFEHNSLYPYPSWRTWCCTRTQDKHYCKSDTDTVLVQKLCNCTTVVSICTRVRALYSWIHLAKEILLELFGTHAVALMQYFQVRPCFTSMVRLKIWYLSVWCWHGITVHMKLRLFGLL